MSSKKLSTPDELNAYGENQAFIRIFKYSPLKQYDHLVCVHGDRGQGAKGEVAHLKISENAYHAIAERYPVAERESHLYRSDFFAVAQVLEHLQAEATSPAEQPV